jgi:hypothetical protein
LDALFGEGGARMRRWPVTKADTGKPDVAELELRPIETVIKLADYDHDGRATEFILVVGSEPCGHTPSVLVGISKDNAKLHAFGTAEKPSEPLTLERPADWERLRAAGSAELTMVACGDHGADTETKVRVRADGQLHATESNRKCP